MNCSKRLVFWQGVPGARDFVFNMPRFYSLPLHENVHFAEKTADLLNEEWPRSKAARLHSLSKNSSKLPYGIVYVEDSNSGETHVLGYSRLCKVHGRSTACFIESVVVSKAKRGQGYGRKLMAETEEHAKRMGFNQAYLTTHDKQKFYEHLGYTYCQPILSLGSGSNLLSEEMCNRLFGQMNHTAVPEEAMRGGTSGSGLTDLMSTKSKAQPSHGGDQVELAESLNSSSTQKLSICDIQSSTKQPSVESLPPPPCPPIPPPAPPPPLPAASVVPRTAATGAPHTPLIRLGQDTVYWMMKIL